MAYRFISHLSHSRPISKLLRSPSYRASPAASAAVFSVRHKISSLSAPRAPGDDDDWRENMDRVRNVGIYAHTNSEKTALRKALYHYWRMQEVNKTIHLEHEIPPAASHLTSDGFELTIVDIPCERTFTADTERKVVAVDGIVVSVPVGASNPRQFISDGWHWMLPDLPRIIFISNLDGMRADPWRSIHQAQSKLQPYKAAVQVPIGSMKNFKGIVDLVELKAYEFDDGDGRKVVTSDIPSYMQMLVATKRSDLVEVVSEVDDELAELFVHNMDIPREQFKAAIRRATLSCKFVPIFMGNALQDKGIHFLLNGIKDYLPSPADTGVYAHNLSDPGKQDINEAHAGQIVAVHGVDCALGDFFTDGTVKYNWTSPNLVAKDNMGQRTHATRSNGPYEKDNGIYLAVIYEDNGSRIISRLGLPWEKQIRDLGGDINELIAFDHHYMSAALCLVQHGLIVASITLFPTPITRNEKSLPLMKFHIWPREKHASVTIYTKESGGTDWLWESSHSYNVHPLKSRANSTYLEFEGEVPEEMVAFFSMSLDTHYITKDLLGEGAEARVYRCVSRKDHHVCALKVFKNADYDEPRESTILKDLAHDNIRRSFVSWREGSIRCMALEMCESCQKIDKERKRKCIIQIGEALKYIHDHQIIHRDISPSNIFVNGKVFKLGDFGQCTTFESKSSSGDFYGHYVYASPEMWIVKEHDEKCDIYSFGLVLFEICGPPAIRSVRWENIEKLKKLLRHVSWRRDPKHAWTESRLSNKWQGDFDILVEMVRLSPSKRPSAAKLLILL